MTYYLVKGFRPYTYKCIANSSPNFPAAPNSSYSLQKAVVYACTLEVYFKWST